MLTVLTMSAKKDAIVNMGGFMATNIEKWYEEAKNKRDYL